MSFLKRLMARKADIAAEARIEDEAYEVEGEGLYDEEAEGYDEYEEDEYEDGEYDEEAYYEDDEYEAYEEEDIEDDLAEFPVEEVEDYEEEEAEPAAAAAPAPAPAVPAAAAPTERMDTRAIVRQIATTEMRNLLNRVAEQSPHAAPAALEAAAGKAAKIWDLDDADEDGDDDPHRVTTEATLRAVAAAAAASVSPPEPMPPTRTLSAMVKPKLEADPNPAPMMPDPVIPSPEITEPKHLARDHDAPHLLKQPSFEAPAPQAAAPAVPPPPAVGEPRPAGRQKTRLLGFQSAPVAADVFDAPRAAAPAAAEAKFPTGWIVVVDGPGRGASFTLGDGVTQIGRGEDQGVRLDFGDTSISRNNHAAVAFDGETGSFFLGHGGKTNLVRLNGRPVLATEDLQSMDEIRIGETTLRFVAFCGEDFTWAEGAEIGQDAASA